MDKNKTNITNITKNGIVKGKIANAITSVAKNHIVATTDDLYDVDFKEYQDSINKRLNGGISELRGEITKVKGDITAINGKIATIQTDITKIKGNISTINNEITTIKNNINSIQGDITTINSDITKLKNNITTINREISVLQNDITSIKNEITTIHGDISTINSEISVLQNDIITIQNSITEINSEIDNLHSDITGIKNLIPEEATPENQLADKQFVIDLIHNSSSAFRGEWDTWSDVPSNSDEYPEDGEGNRIPRQGDYIIIADASEYVGEDTGETYVGTWKFAYMGEWDARGKNGWKPEYRINEEPDLIIDFRKKKEGEPDENSTFITSKLITRHDVLTTYPELDYSEFVNGGYWDTNITDLRNISASTVVYYITPFMTSGDNRILLKICYENGWSSSPDYITLSEAQSITDEMVAEAAKKLVLIEDENGNIIPVFDSIIFEENEETNIVMTSYSLYDGLCWDKNGNEYNIRNCFCYSKEGVRYDFSEVNYGNCFYELESWTELPDFTGITSLGDGETYRVFLDYSRIRDIILDVNTLPAYTLFRCVHLENIYIPSGLTDIETYALASCDGLQSLVVDENNPKYTSRDSNGNECNCIVEKPVITRGTRSAINNQLTLIQGCNVTTLPDNIKHIASGAFDECTRLTGITLPDGLLTMGDNVFRGCTALSGNIVVPNTVESIGESTFRSCTALESVNINVPIISNYLFKDCTSLSSVTLGNNVTTIGNQAFMNDSSLTAITIPDSVTVAGISAFANCDLRSINTNNIESIGNGAFANNSGLSNITMTDSTVNIGNGAFANASISAITIPQNVRILSQIAFMSCDNLQRVVWDVNNTETNTYNGAFIANKETIISFEFGEHCTVIPNGLCNGVINMTGITIPNHITKIGARAFAGCPSLTEIIVPDNLITTYRESQDWYDYRELIFGTSIYTITFDSMGGETTPSTQNVRCGAYIENPGTIHKDLYEFEYWEDEDGNEWNFEEDYVAGDMTLYAHYREVKAIMVKSISNDVTNISMGYNGSYPANVEYSYDGANWYNIWNNNYLTISLSEGYSDYVYFRGYNPYGFSRNWDNYTKFNINNGQCDLLGNLMYLKDYNNTVNSLSGYEFIYLFQNCYAIRNCNKLTLFTSATTLASNCYTSMFSGCTSLTTAPELPANTLADYCYNDMFNGCSRLRTAPVLPATTLTDYCYRNMFEGCSSLVIAPELPATTLTNSCYYRMFRGCSSLTAAPELPATTLASSCYSNMFSRCTSLTEAPELPATTLAEYCYYYMFYRCSNLNYIKCLAINISASDCTSNWVNGVQTNSGVFVKHPDATSWTTGNNGIPTNWTVEDAVTE